MPRALSYLLLTSLVFCTSAQFTADVAAENWPQFRGPSFNGSTSEKDLPAKWDEDDIAWTAELPGPSAATPAIWGDHIFVSSVSPENKSLEALAIDRRSGKKLWQHTVADGVDRDKRSNYASNSPATDGKVVVFFYGRGELVAYDFAGKEKWKKDIAKEYGDFAFLWTYATSPVIWDGRLYIQVLQRDTPVDGRGIKPRGIESYVLALDPANGEKLWKVARPSKARAESRESFATPVPWVGADGQKQLLVVGGDALTGHDVKTGKELWRWGTWNPERIGHWRHVPSAVAGEGIALVCAPKKDPVYAIRLGDKGELGKDAVAWVSEDNRQISSDVPTPAFADGEFFLLSDVRKSLSRIDPKTGDVRWTTRLPGNPKYEASPTIADGKVYLINFAGEVVVVDAKEGEILSTWKSGTTKEYPVRSSIVASQGQLFVRGNRKLWAIGK